MGKYTNSLIRKHRKPDDRIISGHDNSEQTRELEELQHGLAERISKIQRAAQRDKTNRTGQFTLPSPPTTGATAYPQMLVAPFFQNRTIFRW